MAIRTDIISELINENTGENVFASIVTTNTQGIVLTDANKSQYCGGLYTSRQVNGQTQFLKWNTSGAYPISRLKTVNQENLQKLINDFGNSPASILLDSNININSGNLTIPENITIVRTAGAVFIVNNGYTLTINSYIDESPQLLFTGTGNIVLSNKTVKAEWFDLKGDGITDDTLALQKIINSNAAKIIFESTSKVYLLDSIILKSNITITGNSPQFKPKSSFSAYEWFKYKPEKFFTQDIDIVVNKGSNLITTTLASNFIVGDIIELNGGESYNDGLGGTFPAIYKFGHYAQIIDISGNNITLSNPAVESFNTISISGYKPVENVHIYNVRFDTNNIENISVITLQHAVNSSIEHCEIKGYNSVAAIISTGINCKFAHNKIDGFPKVSYNGAGYGIAISGHNIIAEENYITNCKHALTAGSRNFMSTAIHYRRNILHSSTLAPMDMHGNVQGSMTYNEIHTNADTCLLIRNGNIDVTNNYIYSRSLATLRKGIVAFEQFYGNCSISNNRIIFIDNTTSTSMPIQLLQDVDIPINNLIINNNYSNDGFIRIESILGRGNRISNNYLDAESATKHGYLSVIKSIEELKITGNTFINKRPNTDFNFSIALSVVNVLVNVIIEDNNFIILNATNLNPIIRTDCEGVKIKNNTINSNNSISLLNDVSTGKRNLHYNNKRISSSGVFSTYTYTTLPTASAFYEGEFVTVTVGSKNDIYVCIKSGSSTWLWNLVDTAQRGSIANGVDINTLTSYGVYVRGTSSGNTAVLNYPFEGAPSGNLIVQFTNSGFISQTYHTTTNRMFIRFYSSSAWSTWKELTTANI